MKKNTKKFKFKSQFKLLIVILVFSSFCIYRIVDTLYHDYQLKHAKINVILHNDLNLDVYSKVKLSEVILHINGNLIKDSYIDTTHIGKKKVKFYFINDDNIKVSYSFDVNIVDNIPPQVNKVSKLTVEENEEDIASKIFCGDNYDDKPKCEIIGDYDISKVGEYNVVYKAEDKSKNYNSFDFVLEVVSKKEKTTVKNYFDYEDFNEDDVTITTDGENFKSIYDDFKKDKTKIGIDISFWQGKVDYKKVKETGCDFVILRLGTQKGLNGGYILDKNFKKHIEGFKKVNMKVGVYFYSYADSMMEAEKQANWVLKQIKGKKIDCPVVFDWENWDNYRKYNLSFYHLNKTAEAFIKRIELSGYKSMLYTSKAYLDSIWAEIDSDIWVAHYYRDANYNGVYKMWQITDSGIIDGINSNVDINIMYK